MGRISSGGRGQPMSTSTCVIARVLLKLLDPTKIGSSKGLGKCIKISNNYERDIGVAKYNIHLCFCVDIHSFACGLRISDPTTTDICRGPEKERE